MVITAHDHDTIPDHEPLSAGTRLAAILDASHSDNLLDCNRCSAPFGPPNSLYNEAINQKRVLTHRPSNEMQQRPVRGARRLFHTTFSFIAMISPLIFSLKDRLVKKRK